MFRYPGGKRNLWREIKQYLPKADMYVDPFVGGGYVALNYLATNPMANFVLNDKSPGISAIWEIVIKQPDALIQQLEKLKPSVDLFFEIKQALLENRIQEKVDLAAKKIACHQWSYSGLGEMAGGPIGGKAQRSKYKIDCRWNPEGLRKKIYRASELLNSHPGSILCQDGVEIVREFNTPNVLLYVDPPYIGQGEKLYREECDAIPLRDAIADSKAKITISYDDTPMIRKLYKHFEKKTIKTNYSIKGSHKKGELLIWK